MFDRIRRCSIGGRAGALVLAAAAAVSLMASGPALATTGHLSAGTVGGPGSGAGEFTSSGPAGVAVRASNGDIYVTDQWRSPARVERFDAGGDYQSSFTVDPAAYGFPSTVAIDPTGAGAVYLWATDNTTFSDTVVKYSLAGVFAHALSTGSSGLSLFGGGLGVDPGSGTVYASAFDPSTGGSVVASFDGATGALLGSFDGSQNSPDGAFLCLGRIAVAPSGDVLAIDTCKNRVDRYDSTGAYVETVDDGQRGSPSALTVDPASGDVLVAENGPNGLQITQFPASGSAAPQSFGAGRIQAAAGLAVNPTTGAVYVADSTATVVRRFAAFDGPTVTTTAGAPIDPTSETLNGTIDPGGVASTFHFDYGTTTSYGSSTSELGGGSGSSASPVSDTASGLMPNTTYHYRIVGANDFGAIVGNDQTFTTSAAAPTLDTTPAFASNITSTDATINASVNPNGSATTYHFEYGTSTTYGTIAPQPDGDAGNGGTAGTVSTPLTGLAPGTTYHFRVVADNGVGGPQPGADATFTTAPAAPASAADVTAGTATLTGTINPHGTATNYHFDYGTTTTYGTSTPEADGGAGNGDALVTSAITGLDPSTTYHVRVVATANGQTTTGVDGTFTTAPAPAATATAPTAVVPTGATVTGVVDTHGVAGSVRFLVAGVNNGYLRLTDPQPVAAKTGTQAVTARLDDLPSAQGFEVVVRVTSNDATTASDPITFVTPPTPPAAPQPPPPSVDGASAAYGCAAPSLQAFAGRPKPGDVIHIAGGDLGLGGTVALGKADLRPTGWSATGFSIELPDDATGVLPLTVNCGAVSNTIAITMYKAPDNRFTVKASTSGSRATLKVTVPGAGRIAVSGKNLKSASATAKKAGAVTIRVSLSSSAARSLARHHSLKASASVRFTPAGGSSASKSVALGFKRK
jgi:hypothetical protein